MRYDKYDFKKSLSELLKQIPHNEDNYWNLHIVQTFINEAHIQDIQDFEYKVEQLQHQIRTLHNDLEWAEDEADSYKDNEEYICTLLSKFLNSQESLSQFIDHLKHCLHMKDNKIIVQRIVTICKQEDK